METHTVIYLDANSGVPPSEAAIRAWTSVSRTGPMNPSSVHCAGRSARRTIERARDAVAEFFGQGWDPECIHFTSGGTESNNIVINGFARIPGASLACLSVEHPSVASPVRAAGGVFIPVDGNGIAVLAEAVSAARSARGPLLLCIQAANSETGIMQPVEDIASAVRAVRDDAFILVDAAQSVGRTKLEGLEADAVTFSGHKLHGPPGTGVLHLSDRLRSVLPRALHGGGQEGGVRPGTESVAGAHGLAAALEERAAALDAHVMRLKSMRDRFELLVMRAVPDASVVGAGSDRVANTSCVMFPGRDAQSLMARLDVAGVACSTGSACSSGRPQGSSVLKAMGHSDREATSSLRFSFSVLNRETEVDEAVGILSSCLTGR